MTTEDQQEVIAFLERPDTHGLAAGQVERIDTHSASVFLAGDRAYKLKRAVKYDYLDFSTVERRRAMCEAEAALNARSAPSLYRGVLPIVRQPNGTLALGGRGIPVDYVVHMVRFDQALLLDRLATAGRLDLALMPPLADAVVAAHSSATRREDHGGVANMRWVVDGNAESFHTEAASLDAQVADRVVNAARAAIDRHGTRLEARRRHGCVRGCHGDLHLGNIVLFAGRPVPFDGVEFNDEVSCIDVGYDLAFLLMDLWRLHLAAHANALFNRYLAGSGDAGFLPVLPLFLSCRAAVRAKTGATSASLQTDEGRAASLRSTAMAYLALAETLLSPAAPRLLAIGGLAGTGKSTLARALAPSFGAVPGAVILRSDAIRKAIFGKTETTRLDTHAYTAEVSRRVYARLRRDAAAALEAGHSVIVDAVFMDAFERAAIADVARSVGAGFHGLWLEVPFDVSAARLTTRRDDASDADVDVLRRQHATVTAPVDWPRVSAAGSADAVARAAHAKLGLPRLVSTDGDADGPHLPHVGVAPGAGGHER